MENQKWNIGKSVRKKDDPKPYALQNLAKKIMSNIKKQKKIPPVHKFLDNHFIHSYTALEKNNKNRTRKRKS